jgi:autotransporter-associated beta strand protein
VLAGLLLLPVISPLANIPGGGTGTGANVTLTDSGTTVTIGNGIVSILCTKSGATINQINYTYNNGGGTQILNLLSGGNNGGQLYWENSSNQGLTFTYALIADPASNGGNYAEISLTTTSVTGDVLEVHYSLLRGSTGFYVTAIWYHRSTDGAFGMGECRDNIYAGSIFNWMSVDAQRNRLMEVSGGSAIGVQGAPVEVSLWTNGIYAGQYEDKYKYSADLGVNHVWGWSSVGTGGKNIGLWNITASSEYYNGGPLKRELMEHIGTTILNMLNGGHYGMGADGNWATNEVWTKVDGPYFIYCNNVTNTLTGTNQPAQALYNDALAQGAAEAGAWPYAWFANTNYALAANRGNVTGKIVISDSGYPNASAAGLWVGLIQQPVTTTSTYDFQQWMKPYQFWTKTDANGNFTVTNVIAGTNYTLYAFGPGAPAMFMSQTQTGGNPPVLYDLPANQFAVTVAGSTTTNLNNITWTPARVGATVFEIGYPNRTSDKFRHGDDWWVGEIGPKPTAPSPIWSKWLEFPFDFPNGVNYVVGQSRWNTDWNFVQPVVVSSEGAYNNSSSTITFNLATAPTNGATASLYLALSSDYYSAIIVTINGNNLGNIGGVTGSPNNSFPTTGYYPGYSDSDATIREGNQAAASDERINFSAAQLHAGLNTINIGIRQIGGSYFADHAMYDYLRLELTGYVPPPPASVAAYAGNNCNLVTWPVTPGATSYNLLRSTNSSSGFVSITNGVTGPVCGSGANNAACLDASAINGTNYFYVVRSVNPTGSSTNSPASPGATPAAGISASAPAAPTGLAVGSLAHQSVMLNWNASSGANYYCIWRSTLANSGGGSSNTLSTILLNNAVTNTSYTDASPTDGSIYNYFVTAIGAGGTSTNSAAAVAVPLPASPATLPASLTASFVYSSTTNITLNWTAVPGAVGYVVSRATSSAGPYVYLQTVTETTYTDYGLNPATIYFYRVAAMNAAGVSANAGDSVNSQQSFPTNLTATATNAQITLTWPATTGATNYTLKRGTSSGSETVTVVTGYAGTTYTNTGLVNGTTYFYVVTAAGAGGTSGNSPEASATPLATGNGIWISPASGNWSDATNWIEGGVAAGPVSTADFSTLSLPTNLMVTLDSARAIGSLIFGDTTGTYNWTLAGTNPLTLGNSPSIEVVNQSATISAPLVGTNGLSKTGLGALTFGGATNTFSGGLTIFSGNVTLDFSAANSPVTNIISAANSLTLGGSTLQIIGSSNAVNTQTFAATALNAGASVIVAAPVAGANLPKVNLAGITANPGGVVEFIGPATVGAGGASVASNAVITTTASGSGAFVSSNAIFATVGLYDFAATVGAASPYTVVGGSQISGFYIIASGTAGTFGNLDVTGNITGWSAQPYLTSMRFNLNAGANLAVTSYSTLTLADILVTPNVGAHNVTYNSGVFRPNGNSSGPFVVWQNNTAGELVLNTGVENAKNGISAYVQSGPGTVVMSSTGNSYTDQNYLNGGVMLIAGNGSLGAPATAATVNLNGGTLVANSTFALDNGSAASARFIWLNSSGGGLAATAGNKLTVDGVIGSAANTGPLTIGVPASSANNNVAGLLPGTGAGTANAAVYATGTVVLTNANYFTGGTVLQTGTLNINGIYALGGANYGGLTFNGGTLQYAANFITNNGSSDLTSIGSAGITLAAGGGTIDLNGNSVTYANAIGNNGPGALTVKSSLPGGVLNLPGGNNYSGNTTVTNATLSANNFTGSATGSGSVLVQNAGVLSGNGALAGSVTIAAGGTLSVGNASDSLALGNNLTLNAGSATRLQIQHSPLTNSSVTVGNTLTFGGALIVTNLGGPLASGDSFPLFTAANYVGAFTSITLPALATNLVWSTNLLGANGTLSVAAYLPPAIGQIAITGTNLIITGSGGIPGWNYCVLTATNLAAPNWLPAATNQFDADGNFMLTNPISSESPQIYFRLQLQ